VRLDVTQGGEAGTWPKSHDFTGDWRALTQWTDGAQLQTVAAGAQYLQALTVRCHPVDQRDIR